MVAAFGASRHMPAESFGSAGFNRRHHLELAETDMTRIGPPPRGAIVPKDICDLQPWARQPPGPLLQPSPDGVILQLLQHLIRADSAANGFGRDMRVARRCAKLGMAQKNLDNPDIRSGLEQVRGEAVAQGVVQGVAQAVQGGWFIDPGHMLGRGKRPVQLAR